MKAPMMQEYMQQIEQIFLITILWLCQRLAISPSGPGRREVWLGISISLFWRRFQLESCDGMFVSFVGTCRNFALSLFSCCSCCLGGSPSRQLSFGRSPNRPRLLQGMGYECLASEEIPWTGRSDEAVPLTSQFDEDILLLA